jgi:hypothetical protein
METIKVTRATTKSQLDFLQNYFKSDFTLPRKISDDFTRDTLAIEKVKPERTGIL